LSTFTVIITHSIIKNGIKTLYADISFWRVEASRLALFFGGIEFEDLCPSREEIAKMKTDGTFPFGQFPVLQVDGESIAQTGAIARFVENLEDYILLQMNLQQQKSMKL